MGMVDDQYREGVKARRLGAGIDQNPYGKALEPFGWKAWNDGYTDAESSEVPEAPCPWKNHDGECGGVDCAMFGCEDPSTCQRQDAERSTLAAFPVSEIPPNFACKSEPIIPEDLTPAGKVPVGQMCPELTAALMAHIAVRPAGDTEVTVHPAMCVLDRCQRWQTKTDVAGEDPCQMCSERCPKVNVQLTLGRCGQGGDWVVTAEHRTPGDTFCGKTWAELDGAK